MTTTNLQVFSEKPNIQIFHSEQFGQIRVTTTEDGAPMFAAIDVARSLGYTNPQKAIRDHCKGVNEMFTPTEGGPQSMKFIPESDVFRLIMRSKLPCAEQYQDWVCSDILPSVHKRGGYLTPAKVEEILLNPDTIIQLATSLKEEQAKRIAAEKREAVLAPKAELMDKVMDSDRLIDIGQTAKILGLPFGRNTLYVKLREKGIFFINRNEPKQEYINRGYFELKEKWIEQNNHDGFTVIKVLVTQKGLAFIAKLFNVVSDQKQLVKII